MKLSDLFVDFPFEYQPAQIPEVDVTGIALDNRKVNPGDLFIAVQGGSADGHAFIPDAVKRGAVAVVGEKEMTRLDVPYIQVSSGRKAITWLAAAYYGNPGKRMTVIGITGTDGKTTTCNLLYEILRAAGIKTGMISTVNAVIGKDVVDTGFHVTTPDAPDVQRYLAKMVAEGLTHTILETTSHGLAQHRVDAAQYDIAVVTNITHEHLDEHGSYENYRAAKRRLFEFLSETGEKVAGNPRLAVLNRDDASYEYLHAYNQSVNGRVRELSYGMDARADIRAEAITHLPSGTEFQVVTSSDRTCVKTPLVGDFNVSNCLAAFSAAVGGLGIDPGIAAHGLAALRGVPGRMERIDLGQEFTAIVDFAHTPNALKVALVTSRAMLQPDPSRKHGEKAPRVIAVFGSAGLRDKEKRRMMAEISAELADISVLTAEDPRTEDLETILKEMASGAKARGGQEGLSYFSIPDRGEAIRFAVRTARPGDIVLSFGKGHEQSMCFGSVEYPWDDRTAMHSALSELLGVPGPEMPELPTSKKM